MTANSDASWKNLKSEVKKINYDVVDASSKNLKISRKSSTRSTSDSILDRTFDERESLVTVMLWIGLKYGLRPKFGLRLWS